MDYSRDLFEGYVKFCKKLDEKKKRKKDVNLGKKDAKKLKLWRVRILNMLREKCSSLVSWASSNGFLHLVFEDLGVFGKNFSRAEEFEGFKYSRLVKLLRLGV
jgi:hypothetical protein